MPHRAPASSAARQRGTVYLITLSTAMIVAVMGLSSIMVMRIQHREALLDADLVAARLHARAAAELAMHHLQHDADWHQLGEEDRRRELPRGSFSFRYLPVEDTSLTGSPCESVIIEATGRQGDARSLLEVRMRPVPAAGPRSYGQAIVSRVPLAYYPLDEVASTLAHDRIADRHGQYANVQLHNHDATHCLYAAYFNGQNAVVQIDHDAAFRTNNGSILFWFRPGDPMRFQGLVSKSASGYNNGGNLTIILDQATVTAELQSTHQKHRVSSSTIEADRWHHVALTFGGTGLRLYLNGELVASHSYDGGLVGNAEPIAIGADLSKSESQSFVGVRDYFRGHMQHVAFFNHALTAPQIQHLYEVGRVEPIYLVDDLGFRDRTE